MLLLLLLPMDRPMERLPLAVLTRLPTRREKIQGVCEILVKHACLGRMLHVHRKEAFAEPALLSQKYVDKQGCSGDW